MRTFVVGDIQGCFQCLEELLGKVAFDPANDRLLAVGDLVNRGPRSLETLRFCHSLGSAFQTVLGNHDLHLLALDRGKRPPNQKDTLSAILDAPDREQLLGWLQSQPLLLRSGGYVLVHAGIPPQWTLAEAEKHAREVEAVLADEAASTRFFRDMYGNTPSGWRDDLEGTDRLRVITNYFTRMRYCDGEGNLDLTNKLAPPKGPAGFSPWFAIPHRKTREQAILFGHWASLEGNSGGHNVVALDTGCVWGGRLRMICLETGDLHHHSCEYRVG